MALKVVVGVADKASEKLQGMPVTHRANEDSVTAQLHHHGRIGRRGHCREVAGREVASDESGTNPSGQ